jgi:hypothetical protein
MAAPTAASARSTRSTAKREPLKTNLGQAGPQYFHLRRKRSSTDHRKVRAAPKIEYSELAQESVFVNHEGTLSKPPSRSTLYKELLRRGPTNHKAKSVQSSTAGMLLYALSSLESIDISDGGAIRSSS